MSTTPQVKVEPKSTNSGDATKQRTNLDLACIGNCAYSALIDKAGQIVWSCFPRFDGDPIFCSLLKLSNSYSNDIGFFDISLANCVKTEQSYLRNSPVLSTKLYEESGSAIEIIDFIPRFEAHEREYRPNMIIRIVKPIAGRPRARIRLRPTFGYGWGTPEKTRGSNHIRYLLSNSTIRLTTNAPISYVVDEVLFEIDEPVYLILMPDESLKSPIDEISSSYLNKTLDWWRGWSRNLTIPFEYQDEVIRAAISLKLSSFEETGAIVAAMTTSIPTGPNGDNFDYRYCWLRDATVIIRALNQVSATGAMEGYLRFLTNVVATFRASKEQKRVYSVYGVSLETRLHERDMHRLPGYRGSGPVKLGNKDSETVSNDVFGSAILALFQVFFDRRLKMEGDQTLFNMMEELGQEATTAYNQPDFAPGKGSRSATAQQHTYSSVMCWVACDRLAKIAGKLQLSDRSEYWKKQAEAIKADILKHIWSAEIDSFVSVWDSQEYDAMLLLLPSVGFVSWKDPKFLSTIARIEKSLLKEGMITKSSESSVANNYATFAYINALHHTGRSEEAKKLFQGMLGRLTSSGMLSENIDIKTGEAWGNFPQNTALAGLITCAISLSKPWDEY